VVIYELLIMQNLNIFTTNVFIRINMQTWHASTKWKETIKLCILSYLRAIRFKCAEIRCWK